MNDGDHLAPHELTSLMRGIGADRAADSGPISGSRDRFLVFDENAQREFENSASPMRIFDLETLRYLAVNDAALKFYGYTREEFLNLTLMDTRHPEDRADLASKAAEQTGYLRHRPACRQIKKSGETVVVERVTQDVLFNGRKARLSLTVDVTERVRTTELLRQREREFETLAENLPDLIARFDPDHRFVYVNSVVEKLLGVVRHEMIGKTHCELGMPEALVTKFARSLDDAFRTGEPQAIEFSVSTPQGERTFEAHHVPERDAAYQVVTVLSVAHDITERKRAEDALRESNEFLRSVIESSRDCIKVLDLDGCLLSISAGGQRLLEVENESSLLGKSYLDFWNGSDRGIAFQALAGARAGNVSRFEGYCPTMKGVPKWWDELVTPILGKDGKPEKLLVVSRDITQHKLAEDALRESEERFRQLAENIPQVFWINTAAGDNVIYVSQAYEEIWGRSRESLYGDPHSWMNSVHFEDLPRVREAMEKMARGEPLDVEYRIIRPDGTQRWIRDRSYKMKGGDGTPLNCGIAEDVTDWKRAEEELLASAMRQRDALVREVHHRIKNSLQGVAGLLRQKIRKYPAVAAEIDEAVGQLQTVARVYGLQGTRPDGLLSLAEIMDAACSSAESLIGGRVDRVFERESQRPACVAGSEAVSVAVALNELVFNALKHQPAETGKKLARVTLHETLDAAEIRIINHGRLPAGFDFTGGRAIGNGLGLVRTLLASPGGSVAFNGGRNEVEVVLKLRPPMLAARQQAYAS